MTKAVAMRDSFIERIWTEMKTDNTIVFITADFGSPMLDKIRSDFSDRFFNVGIAEQNLVNVAAGMALEGFRVFAYAIAPFITMRCYEQIRISLALINEIRPLNVTLIGVGAGCSYTVSGPSHQCYEDISLMRALPTCEVFSASDHISSKAICEHVLTSSGLNYVRLDAQVLPPLHSDCANLAMDKGFQRLNEDDSDIVILATGYMAHVALTLSQRLLKEHGMKVGVLDIFNLSACIGELHTCIWPRLGLITLEEGFAGRGGMDSLIFDWASNSNFGGKILNIGVNPGYKFELGTRQEIHDAMGIGENEILDRVLNFCTKL
jgi:transketolase